MISKIKNYYSNLNTVTKATIWFVIATTIQKCINFITMPIFTRMMSVDDYGIYTMYVSWINIFFIFTSLRLDGSVFNKGMSKFKDDRVGFIVSIQLLSTIITIIVFIIYLIFNNFFNNLTEFSYPIMILMFIQLLFMPAYNFWILKKRYEYNYIKFSTVTILTSLINVLIGIIVVKNSKSNLGEIRVYSYAICQIFFSCILYFVNIKNGIKKLNLKYIKYALKFNIPLVPHYVSQYILDQLDRIMIQKMINIGKAAVYNACYSISFILKVFSDSFIAAITPWYYDHLDKKEYKKISDIFLPVFLSFTMFIILFVLLAPELVKLILPSKYYSGIPAIPPISISIIFLMMYSFFGLLEFYFEETKFSMFISSIGAVLNFVLNYIFIKKFGFIAAGYTSLICYILFAIVHYYFSKHITIKNIGCPIFNDHSVIGISILCILLTLIIALIYNFILIRILFVLAIVIIIIINRKRIKIIFNTLNKDVKKI